MKTFRRILAYAKPYGRYWPGYLVLSIFSVIFGIANYALIGPMLSVLFEPDTMSGVVARPEFSLTIQYVEDLFQYYLSGTIIQNGVIKGLDRKSVV